MDIGVYLLAIVSPLLYAATNHFDNILLAKYFKEGGVGTLILFSALLSIIAIPVFYLIDPTVLGVDMKSVAILILVGLINVLLLWCYLQAVFTDEPTVVIIYYQLVPVIGLGLGYVILGETLTSNQMFAMIIIIMGALVLTVALDDDGKIVFRGRTAFYMLIASTCWAFESVLFKLVALEENVWRSLFWEHSTLGVIGILILIFIPHYRKSFQKALRLNSGPILSLNVTNEVFYMTANSVAAFVVVLIPVSLTLLMNSFQPLFVLVIGFILTVFFPKLGVVHIRRSNMKQKLIAIAITGLGAYMLGGW
ncbi:MAG: drug/metabolite transporter (DMT)-like permease [Acidimicrobiales bacterium]|jgi:drug/metabolite transporter (DMT)-like permease